MGDRLILTAMDRDKAAGGYSIDIHRKDRKWQRISILIFSTLRVGRDSAIQWQCTNRCGRSMMDITGTLDIRRRPIQCIRTWQHLMDELRPKRNRERAMRRNRSGRSSWRI